MSGVRLLPLFAAAALVVAAFSAHARALPATPPARPLITPAVDPAATTPLAGNPRPEARARANDRGPVPDAFPLPDLLLQLRRPDEREAALADFTEAQLDPSSPDYHNWLAASDFGALFGPAAQDVDTVSAWLRAQGFTVTRVYESGMTIAFSGNAGLVRKAFGTQIDFLDVGGVRHYANMSDPRIPRALAPAVHGVVALHDFRPRPQFARQLAPEYTISSSTHAIVPADLATIYNLSPLFTAGIKGNGVTIALIEDTDVYSTADISTFRSTFGLGSASFTQVHPSCTAPGIVPGDDGEAELDVEWAAAAAPGATLQLVSCANLFDAVVNVVNSAATPPAIMSISYGACEAELGASSNAFISSTYQQAAARGIAVFVASGDEGAAGCDNNASQATHGIGVNGLASTAYNVAVGGTDFGDSYAGTTSTYWNGSNTATYGSAKSYINEIPWNDSCASQLIAAIKGYGVTYGSSGFCNAAAGANYLTTASGSGGPSGCASGSPSTSGVVGGTCAGRAKPSWQSGLVGNPADNKRDLPDVSLFAANGVWGHYFVYCFTDPQAGGSSCSGAPSNWAGAGGTSFSAPILAGIQALVQQHAGIAFAGNPNPTYYAMAGAEWGVSGSTTCDSSKGNAIGSACIFHDVTQGDMDVNCASGSPNCYRPSGTNGVLSTASGSYLPAYKSGTGWDFATGLGSVNATNLAANWPSDKHLVFTTQPSSTTAGATLVAVKVAIENASNVVVSTDNSAVTLALAANPGGAKLGGTLTVNAVNGVATFSNLTLDKAGTGYTLAASDGGATGATSNAFNISAGAAAKLAFTTQPPASVTSGASFGAAVTVEDAFGNTVTSNNSSVTLALTSANGATLSGTKTHAASSGVATFSGLSIDKTDSYTLTATDGALSSATSTTIAVAHGAAAKLAFTAQPPANAASGQAFGATVTVQDAAGNTVTGNTSTVTLALTSANGATLAGTKSKSASDGVAAFSGLSINLAASYTLKATDGVLSAATSSAIAIAPGAAAKLVFTQQPVNVTTGSALAVAVAIEDAAGNVESADNATQVVLKINACNSAIVGTTTVAGGVAQFPNLVFQTPRTGAQLTAQAATFSAASALFTISGTGDLIFDGAFDSCVP